MRAVDPVAYVRAIGLRPEDSYGFVPLDVDEAASFLFLYRDRAEYAQARVQLPEAESITNFDFGMVGFSAGKGRQADVEMPPEQPGGIADLVAQARAMQQAYQGMPGAPPPETEASRIKQLENLRDTRVIDEATYVQMLYGVQGGHAGPNPGGVQAAAAPDDAPSLVVHRLYPRLYKRRTGDQLDFFMPRYRDLLGLCPEDVYGICPRSTRSASTGNNNITAWEDYWIMYRDRPEYAQGRAAWAEEMNEPGGWSEKMFSSMMKGSWPEAEIVPGVAGPSAAAFDNSRVEVEEDGWPRGLTMMRKKGPELSDALSDKIGRWGYAPEDSFGFCPDFNSNSIFFSWRRR